MFPGGVGAHLQQRDFTSVSAAAKHCVPPPHQGLEKALNELKQSRSKKKKEKKKMYLGWVVRNER